MADEIKPLHWIGSSKKDYCAFPYEVQDGVGFALHEVQLGRMPYRAKILKGFGGASVQEIIADDDGDTYRTVYTVRFAEAVYVLHAFKKKSKRGIATPKTDIDLIHRRFKQAIEEYNARYGRRLS